MNKKLLKTCIIFISMISAFSSVYGENAKVTYVKGKVELLVNENWKPVKVGDEIKTSDTISTGFQSEAKIEYGGSVMSLGAVTRITLEKLSTSASKDDVSLYLKTGAVRSKVTHPQNHRVSYTVKTPVAVASVRGTDFTVTARGNVSCNEGAVAVYPNIENRRRTASSSGNIEEAVEESEETKEESTADNGPADSTTPANEIDSTAPAGAVVVAKNQEVSIKANGNPETPMVNAIGKTEKVKNTVTTAAAQEAVSVGGSSVINNPVVQTEKEVVTLVPPTAIAVTVVLED